ncbi:hypothetical protein [Microbacterium sp. AK031]|uniref:hypothetical protein n=1 Tax=Microbacterium sp. AK031 TaxID=2723076 RepID=UPI00216943CE|nr:hypothetical protein [Microbacterium sp. AK031]MCS3842118.1 hypothetical protein [Microbacterium sp. AK031]
MSDEQPRAEWIFPEEKKSNKGRVWLIVVLSSIAVAIVAALLFLFLPRQDAAPGATASPSPSSTSAPSPSAPATAEPTPTTPVTEAPAPPDPDLGTFREKVSNLLSDADTGLGFVAGTSGSDTVGLIDQLLQDAQRLSDAQAPSSIAPDWVAGVDEYAAELQRMRTDAADGGSPGTSVASEKVAALRGLLGE